MSEDFHTNDEENTLIETVDEKVTTDVVQDIKSGIFSLFVNMYSHMSIRVGSLESMKYCLAYMKEIISHFEKTVVDEEKNTNVGKSGDFDS